jgi:two-component system cell cycle sensor histidine kinase/response regulator CckA
VASPFRQQLVLALWAGAAALLVGGGGLLAWRLVETERRDSVASHRTGLLATAELKSEAIRHWQAEQHASTRLLALSPRVAHPTQALQRGDRSSDHRGALRAELERLRQGCPECTSLTVLDLKERPVAAAIRPGEPATAPASSAGEGAHALTAFEYDVASGRLRLTLAAPVLDDDDGEEQPYGWLVVRIDPTTHLFPLLLSWPTGGRTGELELVERQGDGVVVLNVVRDRLDAAQVLRHPLTRVDSPAVQAVTGRVGFMEGTNYRGVPVLAVARPVEGTPWTLIAKEDLDEVLAPSRERVRLYAVTLAGLLLALLGLYAFLRQRRRVQEVQRQGAVLAGELEMRRRLNQELTRGELRFRSLVLASAQIVWTTNAAGEVVEELPTWQGYTGMTPEEVRGLGWLEAIHPDDAPRVEQAWRQAIAAGVSFRTSYRLRRHDGLYGSFEVQGVPVVEPDGSVAEWIGTCADVSQRQQAEEALRWSELWQRRLIESLGVGVVVHAADTRIVTSNPEASRVLGLTVDQLQGRTAIDPAWRFLREDGSPLPLDEFPVSQVVASRRPFSGKVFGIERGDGGPLSWVLVNAYPINDATGRLENVIVSFSDITSQRAAEAEAVRLAEHLRVSQKIEALGRLAGGVAHDFNNMLSVILGHTAFALDAEGVPEPVREDLDEVDKAGRRAVALTRQLLAFGRRQVLQPRPLDLNQAVAELEKMLRRVIGEDIRLEKDLAAGLWKTMADPAQVDQVITNLVINARDAMPGGGRLTIATGNLALPGPPGNDLPAGDYVVLTVTDTGVGFDAATRARLFEPFFTTKAQGKGTGLGLSTVHGIVSQSGGQVQVESQPGRGATFRILLPRAPAVELAALAQASQAGDVVAGGGETILVAEDERAVRDVARRILAAAGYRVLVAEGGAEALQACREHPGEIHLLLADVVMPLMSGPECAAAAQRLRSGLRILFMSGYADHAIVHSGVLQPGCSLLGKPFSAAELTRRVRLALDGPPPAVPSSESAGTAA